MTEILNNQLRNGSEFAADCGFLAAESSTEPAGHDCPVHNVPLLRERARLIQGWMEAVTCPASDDTCAFDITSDLTPCDGAALYADRPEKVETINVILKDT